MPNTAALTAIAGNPALARQHELLIRLHGLLANEPRCLGAVVVGSLADGGGDEWSDVDLLVYCEAGAALSILDRLSRAVADRPVMHRLAGNHDDHSVFEKVILEDWHSYELHVIEPSTRMRLKSPYVEIVDRDSYLASRLSDDKPIGRQAAKPYVNGDEGLSWELFCCMKWLRRGDIDFTVQYLQSLAESLRQRRPNNGA